MKFSNQSVATAVSDITDSLVQALTQNGRVSWLVSGGSCIRVQVEVMKNLREGWPELLDDLTIVPVDERFGPTGHEDSNYQQMFEAGFDADEAHWFDVLAQDESLDETVEYYSELVEDAFAEAVYVIGTFGMGEDGHTAGILPRSPALTESESVVVGYEAPDYVRMTIVPSILTRCNEAFVVAYGEPKLDALENLEANVLPLREMPATLLYDVSHTTVYNDYINTEEDV